jgi:hypothetical protein
VGELVINTNFLFSGYHKTEHLYSWRCAADINQTIWNLWMIPIIQNRPDEPAKFDVNANDREKTEKEIRACRLRSNHGSTSYPRALRSDKNIAVSTASARGV